jgi:hypothetical protein
VVLTSPRLPRPRPGDDRGVVAVVVALVVVLVVMPLMALVVDLGLTRAASGQARYAADAAALAAAVTRPDAAGAAAAVLAAHRIAAADFGLSEEQWATCVDPHPLPAGAPPSPGDCVSFDFGTKRVRVTVPARGVPSVFAGILGTSPPAASATAVATWGALAQACALCVVGNYNGGAQQLEVHGGDVAIGGNLTVGAGAALVTDAGRTVSVGGTPTVVGAMTTAPTHGSVPTDPFAAQLGLLAAHPYAAASATAQTPATTSCQPGTYQDVSKCTSFAPGVYVLTGIPLPRPLRSTTTLKGSGTGVVFYVTCNTGWGSYPVRPAPCSSGLSEQPRIGFAAGTGSVVLGGHPDFGGLALAFDPSSGGSINTNQRFSGTGTLTVNGSIDGPKITLRDPLTAGAEQLVVNGGRLVVGSVAYSVNPAVPVHPYVIVNAPPAAPVPDGPVRLVPSS